MRAIVIDQPNSVALQDVGDPDTGAERRSRPQRRRRACAAPTSTSRRERSTRAGCASRSSPATSGAASSMSVGDGVTAVEPGQRVVCEGNIGCMRCPRCRAGDTHLCQSYDAVGFTRGGGWGEFVVVPARIVHPLPDHVSFEAASSWSLVVRRQGTRARADPACRDRRRRRSRHAGRARHPARSRCTRPPRSSRTGSARRSSSSRARSGADAVVNVAQHDAEARARRAGRRSA